MNYAAAPRTVLWAENRRRPVGLLQVLATFLLPAALQAGIFVYDVGDGEVTVQKYYAGAEVDVVIPASYQDLPVTRIGDGAFEGCTTLASVSLPDTVTAIGNRAFFLCSGLTGITLPPGLTRIGEAAFQQCSGLTSVTIPDSVTDLGAEAFYSCSGLTTVTLGNGVTTIGNRTFYCCTELANIDFGSQLSRIGDWAFYNCSRLISLMLPGTVAGIGAYAFRSCTGLVSVTFGNHLTSLGEGAFYYCISLSCAFLPDTLMDIGDRAFALCDNLRIVRAGAEVTSIGVEAFYSCNSLSSVVLCSAVETIGMRAFAACGSLSDIALPDSVTSLGAEAFRACHLLAEASTGNGITQVPDWAFYECLQLRRVTLGNQVASIGANAFGFCPNLTDVAVPDTVTSIGDYAFSGAGFSSIVLPAGLTGIGSYAFGYCSDLVEVACLGDAPSVGTEVFDHAFGVTVYRIWGTAGWGATLAGRPVKTRPGADTLPPAITARSPADSLITIAEGDSVKFSLSADDHKGSNPFASGMAVISWSVDGDVVQQDTAGAPWVINGKFTFRTDAGTVQGTARRDVEVRAVAENIAGATAMQTWTVRVNNVPARQTITFPKLPVMAVGDLDVDPGATASSGLPVEYTSSNEAVARVVGDLVQIVHAGTAVISASQPGNSDYTPAKPVAQTLTVKARVTTAVTGGGSVTGAGLYMPGAKVTLKARPASGNSLLHWEDGSQETTRSFIMPNANVAAVATFGPTAAVPPPTIEAPGAQQAMVGVAFSLPLVIHSESLSTVTVTGLPAGLKYDAATRAITGVPTTAAANRTVTITAKNVSRTPATQTFTLTVDPLPAWAQGSFSGWFASPTDSGPISFAVTARGKITGKFTVAGMSYTFSAAAYGRREGDGSFWMSCAARSGKASMPLTLAVRHAGVLAAPTLAVVDGWLAAAGKRDEPTATLYRTVWKDAGMAALAASHSGYYTATLPGGDDYGSGYLTFTVDPVGGFKTVGRLADGTALSLSGSLVLDESGAVFAVLYTAPKAYNGGSLFGLAEFAPSKGGARVLLRLLDEGLTFVWKSRNPQATSIYGDGFERELDLVGGWYNTVGNLYDYYRDRTLTVGTDDGADAPELSVGSNRYAAVCWDPDGLALTPVLNRAGAMTGLSAPPDGTPVDPDKDGVWDYSAENCVRLSLSLKRATGVFTGSFTAWFDYPTRKHIAKRLDFEGVLTPEREDRADGVEGRGFFLWADKSTYQNPPGKTVSYEVNESYDFLLLAPP